MIQLKKAEQLFKTIAAACAAFAALWALFAHKQIADYFKSGQIAKESIVLLCDSSTVKKDLALYTLFHTLRHEPKNEPLLRDIARTMFREQQVKNEETEAALNVLMQLKDTAWVNSLKTEKTRKNRTDTPSAQAHPDSLQMRANAYAKFNPTAVVYIQYSAVADLGKIKNLRTSLNKLNYIAPPAELRAEYKGENEVRYFNAGDEEPAKKLAGALKANAVNTVVKLVPLDNVPLGQLEVWISKL